MDIITKKGFYDLCINVSNSGSRELKEILLKLYELGYSTVAINNVVDEAVIGSDKKKKKKKHETTENSQDSIPEPMNVESLKDEFLGKLNILSRITFECADPGKTHILGHCANHKKYNLYAFVPKSQNALQFACSQLNADVITMKPSITGLKLNRKLYQQAIERGVHFEIQYTDTLNFETRKMAIYLSHLFHAYGKSQNVFISSGATSAAMLRDPYDIVNLSGILGLSETKSKAAMLHQCKTLVLKAERRRRGKGVFSIERVNADEDLSEDDVTPTKKLKL